MAIVNFLNDFVASDPNGYLTITATKITVASALTGSYFSVYRDRGAGAITNYTSRFEIQMTSGEEVGGGLGPFFGVMGVSVDSFTIAQMSTDDDGFNTRVSVNPDGPFIGVYDEDSNNFDSYTVATPFPKTFFIEQVRSGTGADLVTKIYENSDFTGLVDTLTEDAVATTAFRYELPIYGVDIGTNADLSSGYIKHFDPLVDVENYEDFLKYTEVDLNGKILVSSNHIKVASFDLVATSYVMKDYGENYFGNFNIRSKLHVEDIEKTGGQGGAFIFNAFTKDPAFVEASIYRSSAGINRDSIFMRIYKSSNTLFPIQLFAISEDPFELNAKTYNATVLPVDLWVGMDRTGTLVTASLYTDEFSTLLTKLSINNVTQTYLRYHTAIGAKGYTGDIGEVDVLNASVSNFAIISVGTLAGVEPPVVAEVSKFKNFLLTDFATTNMTGPPSTGMGRLT